MIHKVLDLAEFTFQKVDKYNKLLNNKQENYQKCDGGYMDSKCDKECSLGI